MFNVHKPHGIKLLTRLRVGLNHLHEHKFRHNLFSRLSRPIMQLRLTYQNNYSLHSPLLKLLKLLTFFVESKWCSYSRKFLFWSNGLSGKENALIIEWTIKYITTEGFIAPLIWIHFSKSPLLSKSLIDSGTPHFIFSSCLFFKSFYV